MVALMEYPLPVYEIRGMSCEHCVLSVREEVGALPGVTHVDVDLAGGRMTVGGTAEDAAVRATVAEAGYEAVAA